MNDPALHSAAVPRADSSEQAWFQRQWQTYYKMIEHNYLFHREAYRTLAAVLESHAKPFSFLDIACGDATASMQALRGSRISAYCGMDLSAQALELAARSITDLDCPKTLVEGDFVELLPLHEEQTDIAWIGLSLHHLLEEPKLRFMQTVRKILAPGGKFLIYEVARAEGEDRAGWLRRWAGQETLWTAYDKAEWDTSWEHVRNADFPETRSRWLSLGREAGFSRVEELFVAPNNLLALYSYS